MDGYHKSSTVVNFAGKRSHSQKKNITSLPSPSATLPGALRNTQQKSIPPKWNEKSPGTE